MNRASILAVGTELTTGQIINRNAATLSERLSDMGAEIVLHEAVPDERALILGALKHCADSSDLIVVTGGLGPTTDDFTRDVVAQWADLPLEFHEPSWKRIEDRLGALGIPVVQSNRRQCYFPAGATILENPAGTASGFLFQAHGRKIVVLPGPPREIDAIWETVACSSVVRAWLPEAKKLELFTWQCLGKSEAELGEITEKALEGCGFQIGYRAHRPFVEVKVWVPEADRAKAKPWFDRLESAIGSWVATRQGDDLAKSLVVALKLRGVEKVEVLDEASRGVLLERLASAIRFSDESSNFRIETTSGLGGDGGNDTEAETRTWLEAGDPRVLRLALTGLKDSTGKWFVGLRFGSEVRIEKRTTPYKSLELLDRSIRYSSELSLKIWRDFFSA